MTLPLEGIDEKICAEWAQTKRFKHTKSIFDIINSSSLSVVFVQHFLHWWASHWPHFCHPCRRPGCSLISYPIYSYLFHNISFFPSQPILLLYSSISYFNCSFFLHFLFLLLFLLPLMWGLMMRLLCSEHTLRGGGHYLLHFFKSLIIYRTTDIYQTGYIKSQNINVLLYLNIYNV